LEYDRPLQLLKERIIDAWITSYPDVPNDDDQELTTIRLSRMPLLMVVKESHPLLELGGQMSFGDVAQYPLLPLPTGSFPKIQNVLEQIGLLTNPPLSPALDWRGRRDIEDLLVGFSTPLTLPMYGDSHVALPLQVPVEVGDALVVARQWANSPRTRQLVALLHGRLETLAQSTPGVEVMYDSPLKKSFDDSPSMAITR